MASRLNIPPAADLRREHHLWLIDPEVCRHEEATLLALLDAEERDRHRRFHFERDRWLYLVAHGVLRRLLGAYAGRDPAGLRFDPNAYGRPRLHEIPGLDFNLSHCHGQVAVLITDGAAGGVDVERIRPLDDMPAIAASVFAREELDWLQSRGEAGFFRLWVLKEAHMKARGLGFSLPPASFRVVPGEAVWTVAGAPQWRLREALSEGFSRAVCVEDARPVREFVWGQTAQVPR